MSNGRIVDPSQPTQREIAAHNMKVAKANLACELSKNIASSSGMANSPDDVVNWCIGVAEGIIEKFTLMPDAEGNKGGLV